MSADIVMAQMNFAKQQEKIVICDDYGSCLMVYIPFSVESQRDSILAAQQAVVVANQTKAETYAKSLNQTLPTPLTPTQKIALWASGKSGTYVINTVTYPAVPATLVYPQTTINGTVGTAIIADTPTVTGSVQSYTVAPALPAGLSLDAAAGTISGTPTEAAAVATYVVTAANISGSTTAALQIAVDAPSAPSPTT